MLERTYDAAFFNRVCNLPEVRPGLGCGTFQIDVGPLIANPNNVALRTEHGGFILVNYGAGFYSVHTQFAAEGRGQHAVDAMTAGLDFMFTRTDCMRIHSHCPDSNPAALALAMMGGARQWFRANNPIYGEGCTVTWDIFDWLVETSELEREGHAFHELLEKAKAERGSELPKHADDQAHDRVVGGSVRMAKGGQIKKSVLCYNLWAVAAGYAPISIAPQPYNGRPAIDVVDGIVAVGSDGELEVIECR